MHAIAHGVTDTRKRVCTGSWPWEKNPLPHWGIEPASAVCRSDALSNWATSPFSCLAMISAPWSEQHQLCGLSKSTCTWGLSTAGPHNGELRMQKLKSHLVRTQCLNIFCLKPRVSQYIAIHATLTVRDFSLTYFYPSSPFTCIFSKTSPNFFLCWPAE